MTRPAARPALLYAPATPGSTLRFRVVTPDHHPVAATADPALAAATALAVARHHEAQYAAIAASDGRWLEVHVDGSTAITPTTSDATGWPHQVERALAGLNPHPTVGSKRSLVTPDIDDCLPAGAQTDQRRQLRA